MLESNKNLKHFKSNYAMALEFDPTGAFDPINHGEALQELGLIPKFINDNDVVTKGFYKVFDEEYGFPILEMKGGRVDETGVYFYPGDVALYPLAVYRSPTEKCYQYRYGIIAIVTETSTFVTRMD